ncbi:MAG: hypothetical protein U0587_11735 [Candidatus Binatia bacterium]
MDPAPPRTHGVESAPDDTAALPGAATDADQIVERLRWTPKERLSYLLDFLDLGPLSAPTLPAFRQRPPIENQ